MTDSDIQEFNRLVAKRKSMTTPLMTGPTNSATPAKRWVAPSQAALQARADLATANRNLADTRARLAEAQVKLANSSRQAAPVAAKPAPAKPAALTAEAYLASVARPTLTREEFNKIPHGQRGELIKKITLIP